MSVQPPTCRTCGKSEWGHTCFAGPKPKKKRKRKSYQRALMKRRYWERKGKPVPEGDGRRARRKAVAKNG